MKQSNIEMAVARNIAIGCIATVVLLGVIVACGIGGIFWLGLGNDFEKTEQEGVEFGRHSDQCACRDEGLRRLRAAAKRGNFIKHGEAQVFAYGCFETCRPTPDFCAGTPKSDGFFTVLSWAKEQCRIAGLSDDEACTDLFTEVSQSCQGKIERK